MALSEEAQKEIKGLAKDAQNYLNSIKKNTAQLSPKGVIRFLEMVRENCDTIEKRVNGNKS